MVKVFMDWDNETGEVNITKPVTLEKGDFMAVVRRYLFEFGYQIIERLDCARVPDKENEMEKENSIKDGRHWDNGIVWIDTFGRVIIGNIGSATPQVGIPIDDFMEFVTDWLDLQGYDVVKREPVSITYRLDAERENEMELEYLVEWSHKEGVTLHDGNLSKGEFEGICRCFLKEQGYDVTRKEPEIKACPNPECRGECKIENDSWRVYYVNCPSCGYHSPLAITTSETIRLHNLIADNPRRSGEE